MKNTKLSQTIDKFKSMDRSKRLAAISLALLLWIAILFVFAYLFGNVAGLTHKSEAGYNPIIYAFTNPSVRLVTFGAWLGLTALVAVLCLSESFRNEVIYKDDRGLQYLKNPTKDSTRPMTEMEIRQDFTVGDIKDSTETIYGRLSPTGWKDVVTWKKKAHGASGNHNDIVIASMGSGKTATYVINELIQTVLRGDSFVASDPKGELFSTLAQFCKDMGVETHVLDLGDDVAYSECWDCLKEVIDPETERIDSSRLNDFVNIYMENSNSDGKKDFWYTSALNLITAVIGYIAYCREVDMSNAYAELYERVAGVSEKDPFVDKILHTTMSFVKVKNKIRDQASLNGFDLQEIEKILKQIETEIPRYKLTIGEVVDVLLHFNDMADEIAEACNTMPKDHPAYTAYMMYQTNDTETVRKSALQGAQLRFALFADTKVKNILSNKGIDISAINLKQTAVFVICSDKTDTLKPIVSLFFSFFFKDAMNQYDKQQQIANAKGVPNPCRGITAMLEEFFSIGVISGSADTFGKIMSTCRSRNIYVKVIIQYYGQLEALYGPNIKDAIQGGCSTMLVLGINDLTTCKFVSDFLGGSTVLAESHQEKNGLTLGNSGVNPFSNVSDSARPFLSVSELRRWQGKTLIIKQGEQPAIVNPFFWKDHWVVREGKLDPDKPTSIFNWKLPIDERIEQEEILHPAIDPSDAETQVEQNIRALKSESFDDTQILDPINPDDDAPQDLVLTDIKINNDVPDGLIPAENAPESLSNDLPDDLSFSFKRAENKAETRSESHPARGHAKSGGRKSTGASSRRKTGSGTAKK